MGVITALKVETKDPRRIAVLVDGVPRLAVSRPIAAGLQVGQPIDESGMAELERREAVEAAVLRAGRLLSRRPRSEAELRAALRRSKAAPEIIDGAIERLRQAGEIDDLRFAKAWRDNRADFRPRGAFALKAELQRKGVSRQVIDQALEGFSEEEAALAAARKAARRLRARPELPFDQQLYAYLQRRGFGHETISAVVRRVAAETTAFAEREGES